MNTNELWVFYSFPWFLKRFHFYQRKWECVSADQHMKLRTWDIIIFKLNLKKNFNYNAVLRCIPSQENYLFRFFCIEVFVRNSFKHSLFTFLLLHNLHFIYFHPNSYNFKNAVPCLFAAKFSQHYNSGGSTPIENATRMICICIYLFTTYFLRLLF